MPHEDHQRGKARCQTNVPQRPFGHRYHFRQSKPDAIIVRPRRHSFGTFQPQPSHCRSATNCPAVECICAIKCGNKIRPSSGTVASGPNRAVSSAPDTDEREPESNRCEKRPRILRATARWRWESSSEYTTSSTIQFCGLMTTGHKAVNVASAAPR